MSTASDPAGSLRRSAYLLLTAAAVGIVAAKVVGAENVLEPSRYTAPTKDGYSAVPPDPPRNWPDKRPEPTPTFSSNDKSRWATVRALVDHGTFVIGRRTYPDPSDPKKFHDEGIITEGDYRTLDVVMNPDTKAFYSTKPPLLPVLIAGEYWLLKKVFGWDIVRDRWLVIPAILLTINVIPFAVYLVLLARLIETTGTTDFGRLLAFTTACFGTFLTTFAGTFNDHTPAVFAVLFAVYPLVRAMAENRDMEASGYLCSGFFAGLAVALQLPAAAFLAGIGLPLLVARPRTTLCYFVPAVLVPVAAYLLLNYVALGELSPAYEKFGGPWYEYEGSHWAKLKLPPGHPDRKGIDFAAETKDTYAFHLLVGHHGWFSLTPVWLLAAVGLVTLGIRSASDLKKLVSRGKGSPWTPPLFAGMTLAVSVVVIGFYVVRTNNYGGSTSGPRWLFWLTPLWLLALPPAADRLAPSRWGRGLAAVLLGLSVLSVFYPAANPWRSPWIMQLVEFNGCLRY
jgi:hypothetical protein